MQASLLSEPKPKLRCASVLYQIWKSIFIMSGQLRSQSEDTNYYYSYNSQAMFVSGDFHSGFMFSKQFSAAKEVASEPLERSALAMSPLMSDCITALSSL